MSSGSLHQISDLGTRGLGLRRLGLVLRERAWIILLCVLLGGTAATAYVWMAPNSYEATARIKYHSGQFNLLPGGPAAEFQPFEGLAADLKRTASSDVFLRRIVEDQALSMEPSFHQGKTGTDAVAQAVVGLRDRLSIDAPEKDRVVYVAVRDSNAARSAKLANAVAEALIQDDTRNREARLKDEYGKLESVLERARGDLKIESAALQPDPNPAPNAPDTAAVSAELQALSERTAKAELELLRADAALSAAATQGTNLEALLQLPVIAGNPDVARQAADARAKQAAFHKLVSERGLKEKHPEYKEALDAATSAQAELARQVERVLQQLAATRDQARDNRDRLQRAYSERLEQARVQALPASGPTNTFALRQLEVTRQIYDRLIEGVKAFRLTSDLFVSPLRLDEPATAPHSPADPNPFRLTAYGLLGGLLAGVLICLVFGLGDTSLKTVDEIESILGIPVLSVVPTLKDSDTEMAAAEGFRSLRTSIAVSSKGKEPRLVLFTSTSPDEGKTFCALNFSVGLAQQGHKTVLIECDLRRPMAAPSLTMVRVDAPGVSDFLKGTPPATSSPGDARREVGLSFAEIRRKKSETAGDETDPPALQPAASTAVVALEDVVQRTEVANLFFVAAGKPVANPTELLARPRFEQLLNSLLQRYDRVVLDSAPILGVSETLLISSKVQGVCFVVRGGHTPRNALIRAIEILRRADAPLLGAVLNGISPKRSDPYGQDYYYHRTAGRS